MNSSLNQSRTLPIVRDTPLPKLLNGELATRALNSTI